MDYGMMPHSVRASRLSHTVGSSGFSRWGTETSRRVGLFDPKNSGSAERNERSERIRGLDANADTHLPGKWQLPQNFFSFGILRFFRPSNSGIKVDAMPPEGGTTCVPK